MFAWKIRTRHTDCVQPVHSLATLERKQAIDAERHFSMVATERSPPSLMFSCNHLVIVTNVITENGRHSAAVTVHGANMVTWVLPPADAYCVAFCQDELTENREIIWREKEKG